MKLSRGKLSIILFLLGFLFIVLDVNIDTGIAYPNNYNNSDNVIGEFQYYNIKSTYGASCTYKMIEDKHDSSLSDDNSDAVSTNEAKVFFDNIHIDIFNDIVGFILIAIAAFLLKNKGSRQFNYAILLSIISLILSIIIYILPFFVNGILLCNLVFAIGFAYLFIPYCTCHTRPVAVSNFKRLYIFSVLYILYLCGSKSAIWSEISDSIFIYKLSFVDRCCTEETLTDVES